MMLTRLAVGLGPLNALDAASFAPIRPAFRDGDLVPPLNRLLADPIKRNKELTKSLDLITLSSNA
jgi:hypothetical protein